MYESLANGSSMSIFPGKIKDGQWIFNAGQKEYFTRYVRRAKEGDYELSLRRFFKKRTIKQNRLYWKRWQTITAETGYSSVTLHEMAMQQRGYGDQVKLMNFEHFVRISSTVLTTVEFSELMKFQDELCEWLNQDKEPENWTILPNTED